MKTIKFKRRIHCSSFSTLLLLLFFTACSGQGKEKTEFRSETSTPKKFQNQQYENYDLMGKAKTTQWEIFNYDTSGNTGKYYYNGYTDQIDLNFNKEGEPSLVKLVSKSIKAYQQPRDNKIENIVYEKNPVILLTSSSIEDISIDYLTYSSKVDPSTNKLISENEYIKYYYNKYGDLQDYIVTEGKDEEPRYFKFIYKYDKKNNWIERTLSEEFYDSDTPDDKEIIQKIVRIITYY
ncbi:hypothetical protein [Chryseobacterium lathyri]|uniref:Lipoprotein n=1 Tax=Chryseobacterium lathyri TaxID=395933 RepID=A0ABT9SQM1_9FLAO|nr:hypothetical protein [Chryseobacterium lathyri]MDP9961731.1 hypothetical protein [Chryseobacterium lathyri]